MKLKPIAAYFKQYMCDSSAVGYCETVNHDLRFAAADIDVIAPLSLRKELLIAGIQQVKTPCIGVQTCEDEYTHNLRKKARRR